MVNGGSVSAVYIGQGASSWEKYFEGKIDDVKIYNYARTSEQIIEDMNAGHPAGGSPVGSPVAYWKFDEGFSDTAYDELGNNNGTLDAGSSGDNTDESEMWSLDGKLGKAMEFDGTDDYVSTTNQTALEDLESITVSAWIKPVMSGGTWDEIVTDFGTGDGDAKWWLGIDVANDEVEFGNPRCSLLI